MTPIERGHAGQAHERLAVAERDALHALGKSRRSLRHAGRLLLQDLHPPAAACGSSTRSSCAAPPASGQLDRAHRRTGRFEKVHRHVDVLVIGGGRRPRGRHRRRRREGKRHGRSSTRASRWADASPTAGPTSTARRDANWSSGPRRWASRSCSRRTPAALRGQPRAGLSRATTMHRVPRGRGGAGHRHDRAAAGVRGQRPARRDAGRARPPARATSSGSPPASRPWWSVGDVGIDAASTGHRRHERGRGRRHRASARRTTPADAGIEHLTGFAPVRAKGAKP